MWNYFHIWLLKKDNFKVFFSSVTRELGDRQHDIPSDELLDQLATSIGKEMFLVALELGLDCAYIEQLEAEEPANIIKRYRLILKKWRERFNMLATIRSLALAMISAGSDYWALLGLVTQQEQSSDLTWVWILASPVPFSVVLLMFTHSDIHVYINLNHCR